MIQTALPMPIGRPGRARVHAIRISRIAPRTCRSSSSRPRTRSRAGGDRQYHTSHRPIEPSSRCCRSSPAAPQDLHRRRVVDQHHVIAVVFDQFPARRITSASHVSSASRATSETVPVLVVPGHPLLLGVDHNDRHVDVDHRPPARRKLRTARAPARALHEARPSVQAWARSSRPSGTGAVRRHRPDGVLLRPRRIRRARRRRRASPPDPDRRPDHVHDAAADRPALERLVGPTFYDLGRPCTAGVRRTPLIRHHLLRYRASSHHPQGEPASSGFQDFGNPESLLCRNVPRPRSPRGAGLLHDSGYR